MSGIWQPDGDGIRRAADRLRSGKVVAIPTETVYGLAADAASGEAVARIYETKGRPRFNPLIVHVLSEEDAERIARFGQRAERLAAAFWPGPLTIVLPLRSGAPVADLALGGLSTIALRSPAHPVARNLLGAFGRPFVAPSANPSGGVSPTTAAHVAADLPDIPVLDGGSCEAGIESTIVDLTDARPALLRPGPLSPSQIEAALGETLVLKEGPLKAPGMMKSHYAPKASVRLGATRVGPDEVLLGFGGTPGAAFDLSASGDLREAAANLFAALRTLDGRAATIAVAPIPDAGIGAAINDRLARAAAPRPERR